MISIDNVPWFKKYVITSSLSVFACQTDCDPSDEIITFFINQSTSNQPQLRTIATKALRTILYRKKKALYSDLSQSLPYICGSLENFDSEHFYNDLIVAPKTYAKFYHMNFKNSEERIYFNRFTSQIASWMIKFFHLNSQEKENSNEEIFQVEIAKLWKSFARVFDVDFFKPLLSVIIKRKNSENENSFETLSKPVQRCLAEIIAGLIRGSKFGATDEQLILTLKSQLLNCNSESINVWLSALRFVYRKRDYRRLEGITKVIFDLPIPDNDNWAATKSIAFQTIPIQFSSHQNHHNQIDYKKWISLMKSSSPMLRRQIAYSLTLTLLSQSEKEEVPAFSLEVIDLLKDKLNNESADENEIKSSMYI